MSDSLWPLWTVAHQAPLSMGFSRQGYWHGLPFPSPRDLPHSGFKTTSLVSSALAGRFFTPRATREAPLCTLVHVVVIVVLSFVLDTGDLAVKTRDLCGALSCSHGVCILGKS